MRRLALISVVSFAIAIAAHANDIHVEGPPDTLALPPAPFSNHCTVRKAIISANTDSSAAYPQCLSGSGLDTIIFDGPMTITLAIPGDSEDACLTGDLDITQSLIIEGNGATLDGGALDRVFHIIGAGTVVTIRNLMIRNGHGVQGGGGILVDGGTLNLENVTISGCVASAEDGGAIKVINAGTLNMTNCTITGNSTVVHGGGIAIDDSFAHATITSCTITGNNGGFANTTGGIHNGGSCTLRNTIVAGNNTIFSPTATDSLPNIDGTFTSTGYNIIGDFGLVSGNPSINTATGDQFHVNAADLHFGALQDNGGLVQTIALGTGSIAIDKGHRSGTTTDARGFTRPCDLATITNATGGDGADVGAFEVQGTCAGTNTNPDAVDDAVTISEDSGANTISVLANDTDAEGDTLTVTAVTQGAHGSVANNSTSVSYTPAHDFFGSDSFTYTISDGNGGTDTATVSVTVLNVEDPPHATNDSATILEDSGANTINVLANDTDVDGDTLTVTAVTQGAHGSVAISGTSVSYTPVHDFFGSDSFTYTVSDGHGGTDVGTVSMTVQNVNDPPVANADSYTVNQDTLLTVVAPGILGNDTDVDNDALTANLVSGTTHGTLSFGSSGSFTYTPNAHFAGTDSFIYRANDGTVNSNAATVTIHVLDTEPPSIAASVATGLLWPPDHDLVNVGFSFSASDNSGGAVATVVEAFSNEDDVTSAGGEQSPDAKSIGAGTLRLRAERMGNGNGRFYLIRVTAADASSNTSRKCVAVVVPKSLSTAHVNAINAQAQAAVASCSASGLFIVGDGPVAGPKQ